MKSTVIFLLVVSVVVAKKENKEEHREERKADYDAFLDGGTVTELYMEYCAGAVRCYTAMLDAEQAMIDSLFNSTYTFQSVHFEDGASDQYDDHREKVEKFKEDVIDFQQKILACTLDKGTALINSTPGGKMFTPDPQKMTKMIKDHEVINKMFLERMEAAYKLGCPTFDDCVTKEDDEKREKLYKMAKQLNAEKVLYVRSRYQKFVM